MKVRVKILVALLVSIGFYAMLPKPLFDSPHSTVLLDKDGVLLSAKIASDEQWRFPEVDSVPLQLATCIQQYEDAYFHYHPGVNPIALGRALWLNIKTGHVVSGGSTISMQVIRLSRKNPSRTYFEKAWELLLAIRLEFSYSKAEILNLYASHAPYGGNVVGAETASWRYFNRPLHQLSWSESAMLAVLPNSPSLIHLGRNREKLKAKRDNLLLKLRKNGIIDSLSYDLALLERIPEKPSPLPGAAYHAMEQGRANGLNGKRINSTIDGALQRQVNEKIDRYVSFLAQNQIHNACALIVDVNSGDIIAYTGNARIPETRAPYVDLIKAKRSSGSILKPFLYGQAMADGLIHPTTLLRDVPLVMNKFVPSNFNGQFEGVVPANSALYRSLNVPAAGLLRDYGMGLFYKDLQNLGFSTITRSADNYGLSLILGGAEVTLWDLAQVYSQQAANLKDDDLQISRNIHLWETAVSISTATLINRGAWYQITQALTRVQRPGVNSDWNRYASSRKIAWKTGTSHGFKDAWAVGYDKNFVVAVWVGNADGEGRPGLTGVSAAGPILFELFQLLPSDSWFEEPEVDLKRIQLCAKSGLLPNPICPKTNAKIPFSAQFVETCRYHKQVLVNQEHELVYQDCASGWTKDSIIFDLDPIVGYYFWPKHPNFNHPPKIAESCREHTSQSDFAIMYPNRKADLIIPKNLKGEIEHIQLKATHTDSRATLFWHLDNTYLGTTQEKHELRVLLSEGPHTLTIVDEGGHQEKRKFTAALP